jgi:X-Pro dipeptidyl-peptidase
VRLFQLVLLAMLVLPAAALAEVTEELEVKTRDGNTVHIEIARPDGAAKVPVILTYSPYNTLAGNPAGNLASGDPVIARGYARAYADVIGTRNSSGCWDYGGIKEQRSGVDVVNELAKQPWSTGKVGMTGVSYEGTTANMVAAAGADAPGLAAIVPVAAISRWYGYAYQDGVRYFGNSVEPTDEGVDTPLGFDFGFGRTPPDRPGNAGVFADRLMPCDAADHTTHAYDDTPDYDEFWLSRDYRKDAAKFRVPVMVVHGWQDYNVKHSEGVDLYRDIPVDDPVTARVEGVPFKLLHLSQEPHANGTGDDYGKRLDQFWDRTLKGIDNGVEFQEAVRSRTRAGTTAADFMRSSEFPPLGTKMQALQFGVSKGERVLEPSVPASPAEAAFADTGLNTEELALQAYPDELPGQLFYKSQPFEKDTRVAGTPLLKMKLKVNGSDGQLSPTLLDFAPGDPDDIPSAISRGHLNLLYRETLARQVPVPPGQPIDATLRFAPVDQIVKRGHSVGVLLSASNAIWAIPNRTQRSVTVVHGASRLELPVVGPPDPAAGPAAPAKAKRLRLTAALRKVRGRARTVRISGLAPAGSRVAIRVLRGKRVVARARVGRVSATGRYAVSARVRRTGRLRAFVTATLVGGRKVSARSRLVRVR